MYGEYKGVLGNSALNLIANAYGASRNIVKMKGKLGGSILDPMEAYGHASAVVFTPELESDENQLLNGGEMEGFVEGEIEELVEAEIEAVIEPEQPAIDSVAETFPANPQEISADNPTSLKPISDYNPGISTRPDELEGEESTSGELITPERESTKILHLSANLPECLISPEERVPDQVTEPPALTDKASQQNAIALVSDSASPTLAHHPAHIESAEDLIAGSFTLQEQEDQAPAITTEVHESFINQHNIPALSPHQDVNSAILSACSEHVEVGCVELESIHKASIPDCDSVVVTLTLPHVESTPLVAPKRRKRHKHSSLLPVVITTFVVVVVLLGLMIALTVAVFKFI
ncbi:hypothetical protein Pelo_14632 [Pelomyxa schiedti]|nr:hypothetical protein Pelo_14632 [Pelomyxa schiedti]